MIMIDNDAIEAYNNTHKVPFKQKYNDNEVGILFFYNKSVEQVDIERGEFRSTLSYNRIFNETLTYLLPLPQR